MAVAMLGPEVEWETLPGGLRPQPPGARGADLPASGLLEVTPRDGRGAARAGG